VSFTLIEVAHTVCQLVLQQYLASTTHYTDAIVLLF